MPQLYAVHAHIKWETSALVGIFSSARKATRVARDLRQNQGRIFSDVTTYSVSRWSLDVVTPLYMHGPHPWEAPSHFPRTEILHKVT